MISTSFLVGRCGHGVFGNRLVGAVGVLLRGGIFFLHGMVGGDGGVVGPKELVGWVGTVTNGRTYTPPKPRFTEVSGNLCWEGQGGTVRRVMWRRVCATVG